MMIIKQSSYNILISSLPAPCCFQLSSHRLRLLQELHVTPGLPCGRPPVERGCRQDGQEDNHDGQVCLFISSSSDKLPVRQDFSGLES